MIEWKYSYAFDLSSPNRKRLEVSENVKYIAVTLRASKLQVFKIQPGQDLNPGLLGESISLYIKWLTREAQVQIPEFLNFGDLQLWSPWSYSNILYIFGNL